MTNKKIILKDQQRLITAIKEYHDNIDLFITSSKDIIKGTILLITKSDVYLDFGMKSTIKISKKLYTEHLIQQYLILNNSYLLTKRVSNKQNISKKKLKEWVNTKLNEGQTIKVKINIIDSTKDIYTIDLKETINYLKDNKFFYELEMIKKFDGSIKGFVTNSVKGGFSVALGGLIAFLPAKELVKSPSKKLSETFISSSINFKVSEINVDNKNIVLRKA